MKFTQLKEVAKHAVYLLDKHSPVILTGVAVATGITAVVLATNTTIKATRIVDMENAKREDEEKPRMTKWEIIGTVGPKYIPAGLTLLTSASCMIASTAILSKRNAALVSMCALATTQLKEHQDKVEELFGKKKAQDVRVAVEEDKKEEDAKKTIIVTGGGDVLCKDAYSGQMFRSSVAKIQGAIAGANAEIVDTGYISLNDVYWLLGIEQTQVGDECGWHIESGRIQVDFDTCLSLNNEPVLVLRFVNLPRYRYDR